MKKAKLLAVLSFAGIACSLLAGCQPAEPKPEEHVHSYSELHSAVAATCTEAGKKAYYDCTGCDKVFDENKNETTADALVVAALGHNLEHHEETASTCVEHGHVEYYECSVCHDKFSDAEGKNPISETEKALAAHSGVKQDGKVPTCTEPGWKEYYQCSECKAYFEDLTCTKVIEHIAPWKDEGGAGYLAPVGHDMAHIDGDPATCKEDGYKECYFCEECGKYYEDEAGTKLIGDEAAWEAWIVGAGKLAKEDAQHIPGEPQQINRVEPTCTEDGSFDEVVYCTYCGALISSEHKIIEATGHLDVEPIDGLDPTCSSAGYKACYYCNDCKTYFEDQEGTKKIENLDAWRGEGGNGYRAPVAHKASVVAGQAATCEEAGYKSCWQCDDCKEYFEDEACTTSITNYETWKANGGYIAPKGHDTELSVFPQVDAGCETTGVKAYYKCESCGKFFSDSAAANEITDLAAWKSDAEGGLIPAKGHNTSLTHHDGQAETCCANGFEEYWECPDCGLFFSDNAAANKIGDADALADWKTAAGKIISHDHTYGDLISQVDRHRDQDGVKAHYQCSECSGLFDESYASKSAADLAIPNTYGTFGNGDVTYEFAEPVTVGEVITVDFKINESSGTWVSFSFMDDWSNYINYMTLSAGGYMQHVPAGVTIAQLADGYTRLYIDTSAVTCTGTVNEINFMYINGNNTNATGSFEYDPIGGDAAEGLRVVPGRYIYFLNEDYDIMEGKTEATFDVIFFEEGMIAFFLQEMKWGAQGPVIKVKSDGSFENANQQLGVKVSTIPLESEDFVAQYRITVNFEAYKSSLTNVGIIAVSNDTTAECAMAINSSKSYETKSLMTYSNDNLIHFLPKLYKADDFVGKAMSFNYKINGGSTSSDYIDINFCKDWGAMSGQIRLTANGTSDHGGVVTPLEDGWFNVVIDTNRFNGDATEYFNDIYIPTRGGSTESITVDLDSIEFVDFDRDFDSKGDILVKFFNPVANWKTSGVKIQFEFEALTNIGGHQNIFVLVDSNGKNVAAFVFRENSDAGRNPPAPVFTQYNGSSEGSKLENSSVVLKEGNVYIATLVLSDINCLGEYNGSETLCSIVETAYWGSFRIHSMNIIK